MMMGDFKLEVENRSKGFIVFFPDLQGLQVISSGLNIQNMHIILILTLKMYILSFVGPFLQLSYYITGFRRKKSIFANFLKNLSFGPKSSLSCSLKYNKYSPF